MPIVEMYLNWFLAIIGFGIGGFIFAWSGFLVIWFRRDEFIEVAVILIAFGGLAILAAVIMFFLNVRVTYA